MMRLRIRPAAWLVACAALFLPMGASFQASAIVDGQPVRASDPGNNAVVQVQAISTVRQCAPGSRQCQLIRTISNCTGTVIARGTVLTAGHCLADDGIGQIVVTFFAGERRALAIPASAWSVHPGFRRGRGAENGICQVYPGTPNACFGTDVGVIRLSAMPQGIRPIRQAPDNVVLPPGTAVRVLGYGVTDPRSQAGAGRLRSGSVVFTGAEMGNQALFARGRNRSMFCIGDSGGPALVQIGDELMLWGIMASVSSPACRAAGSVVRLGPLGRWVDSVSSGPPPPSARRPTS